MIRTNRILFCISIAIGVACAFNLQAATVKEQTSGYVDLGDGERLFYETLGSGEKTLIVGAHMYVWDWAKSLADDEWTIVGFDARSRGQSSYVEAGDTLNLDQDVKDLEKLRQHLGIEKVSLLGFSFTGKISTLYAMAHPERVDRLIQLAAAPVTFDRNWKSGYGQPQDYPEWAIEESKEFDERRANDEHVKFPRKYCVDEKGFGQNFWVFDPEQGSIMRPLAESLCENHNEWPVHLTRYIEHHGLSVRSALFEIDDLARISMPVLAIHGDHDRNAPIGGAREWAWRLPDARLVTLSRAAHFPFIEKSTEITALVLEFLDGHWPKEAITIEDRPYDDPE